MNQTARIIQAFVLCGILLTLVSCGPETVVTLIPEDHAQLQGIVTAYAYACRELGRPPQNSEELIPVLEKAKVENPQQFFYSTRDKEPYVIIWGLDLEGRFLGSSVPLAYERFGKAGKRLVVSCSQSIQELDAENFSTIDWPLGHKPEQ